MRFNIHRAELPDLPAIMNPRFEAAVLLFLADFQPVLNQENAIINNEMLDASAVVPTAVENDDFACCRKTLHIALNVHFRFLAFRRSGQSHDPEDARADPVDDTFDGASFACGVTALEDDDHPQSLMHHPALQLYEFDLQFLQFAFELLAFHLTWLLFLVLLIVLGHILLLF